MMWGYWNIVCEMTMFHLTVNSATALTYRQFEQHSADTEHLKAAQRAILNANTRVMSNQRRFAKPCLAAALAATMATPLSVVLRTPVTNAVAASVGGKEEQSMVSFNPCCITNSYHSANSHS